MQDVILRQVKKEDIELIRKWRNSKEVSAYMYTDDYISEHQQEKWFNRISTNDTCIYWVIEFDNKALGLAWLTEINKSLKSCYWAFYIGDTSVRGAGIGRKVEYKVLKYVFEELNLNKLRCEVFVFNENVIKMHEKFGFKREAYYREHCYKNGAFHDVVGLAILKSEWESIKSAF